MSSNSFTGKQLEKALKSGDLNSESKTQFTAMIKESEKDGYISVAINGCGSWVEIPVDIIESAEQLSTKPCKDHSHPYVHLILKQGKDETSSTLLNLISKFTATNTNPSPEMPFAARRRGGAGSGGNTSPCLYYSCGTCADGSVMLCTDVVGCPPDLCSDIYLPATRAGRNFTSAREPSMSRRSRRGFTWDDYENCYLDCSFDYPTDSLDQNLCFKRCDRRLKYPLFMSRF